MTLPSNTLLIEGTFEELAEELAQYLDSIKKSPDADAPTIQSEVSSLLQNNQKDEALKKLVTGSAALNGAPERGITLRRLLEAPSQRHVPP